MSFFDDSERYAEYEALFNDQQTDRQARRRRKPRVDPKQHGQDVHAESAEDYADSLAGLEAGFETTYSPSRYEEGWLLSSLRTFYDQAIITDVEVQIKGGKEASVYRCTAHPSTGMDYIAAKVYRPRQFRSLSNDARYRRGRGILSADGHNVDGTDARMERAVRSRSAFGESVRHTSWLMHEFTALETLHAAGADVPEPVAAGENAILMGYRGSASMPAPLLSEVRLEPEQEPAVFDRIMHNVDLMLRHEMIHGDLSPYNILIWEGAITVIDLPQRVNPFTNDEAYDILLRDVTRVCEYFRTVQTDPGAATAALWREHVGDLARGRLADLSRLTGEDE
ncbi:MAG: hypothetical protein GYB64_14465 [Chloroflexi bacterium]|nr:hypothetical protein [Chloroflexota bacterium]